HVIDLNQGLLAFLAPAALGIILALMSRRRAALLIAAVPFLPVLMSDLMKVVPWRNLGLGFLANYRWYLDYGADSLAIVCLCAVGAILAAYAPARGQKAAVCASAVLCAVALAHAAYFRLQQVGKTLVDGNYTALTRLMDLGTINRGARVISVPNKADPN